MAYDRALNVLQQLLRLEIHCPHAVFGVSVLRMLMSSLNIVRVIAMFGGHRREKKFNIGSAYHCLMPEVLPPVYRSIVQAGH